jgi:uncharacterized protein (TIGR02452 family)
MIYSPDVPFFRDDAGALLEHPYALSILTSPAVNAGLVRKRARGAAGIRQVMERRTDLMLALAASQGCKTLILGAWGCGVFRNDPQQIAEIFSSRLLHGGQFHNVFRRIVFAIPVFSKKSVNFGVFEKVFEDVCC